MESQSSYRKLQAAERRKKSWEMRVGGARLQQIADAFGVSIGTAQEDIRVMLKEYREHYAEKAEEAASLDLQRLDELILTYWENRHEPKCGNLLLKLLEQRGKIHGYNAPTKVEVNNATTADSLSPEALKKQIEAHLSNTNVISDARTVD